VILSIAISVAHAGSPFALGEFEVGKALPSDARAVCLPFGNERTSKCKPLERTIAGLEGNLGLMLCDGKVHQASWATLYLPKGHAVPGSQNSVDPMSDAKAGFDALRKHLTDNGWTIAEGGEMGAMTIEAERDGVKASLQMGEVPQAPKLPAGSWTTGVVLERVEPCS